MKKGKTTGGLRTATRVARTLFVLLALIMNFLPVAPSKGVQSEPANWLDAQVDTASLFGAQPVSADGSGNVDVASGAGCMADVAGFSLNCTANDIQIAGVTNLTILDDGCAFPGDTVTFTADFEVLLTAQARHDIGLWFADDGDQNGDGALTGSCTVATPAYAPDPPWLDLDGIGDTFLNTNVVSNIQDTCGDIDADHNPLFPTVTLTVQCIDTDGDGQLNLPNCTSWKQPGDNDLCTSPIPVADVGGPGLDSSGVPPGSPAKCRCDEGFQVPINVPGQIIVDKVTDPSGDLTSFDFYLTGTDEDAEPPMPITPVPFSLTDASAPFESSFLNKGTYQITEIVPESWELTSASCTSDNGTPNDTSDDVTFAYTNGADLTLNSGEIVTCMFNDTKLLYPPDLTVQKDNDADDDGFYNDTETVPVDAVYPKMVPYQVQITNSGASDAIITAISDDTHDISGLVCTHGDGTTTFGLADIPGEPIEAGETVVCTFDVTFANADTTSVTNIFEVTATNDAGTDTASDPSTVNFVQSFVLSLLKDGALDLGADSVANPGDLINYTFLVSNDGNTTLTNVSVTDPDVSPITCPSGNPIPSLAPGANETCTGSYAITQADIEAGEKLNTATADSDQTEPVNSSHTEPIPQSSVLRLVKDGVLDLGADGVANPGDLINYTFEVNNDGNTTLTNVSVTDPDVSPITCPSGNPIPSLAPGTSETCTGSYAITQADIDAGQKLNTATADSDQTEPVNSSHTEPIPQSFVLDLFKDGALDLGADDVANPGDLINYTFLVSNDGNTTLTNVSVTDPAVLPITCPSGNPIPSLAPGTSETCTGSYAITQADIDAGQKLNTATADSDQTEPVNSSHTEPIPQSFVLDLFKDGALDLGADGVANPGDLINYTFLVSNDGNTTLTNVSVTDPDVSPITCPSGNPIPSLAPGANETCTGSYAITQADIEAGEKLNTATADSDQTEPVNSSHTEPIPQSFVLDLFKDGALDLGADGVANPGDLINYTFLVSNDGNTTLTNVSVTDPDVSPITCPSGNPIPSLAPGTSETCTGSYAITQADIDAGQKLNTATADSDQTEPVNSSHTEPIPQSSVLSLLKDGALDLGADGIANPGDLINYTFLVSNDGNTTLTNVSVTDPDVSPITCPSGNPIPSLAPGANETCTGSYAITQAEIDAGQKLNTATANSDQTEPVTSSHTEPIPQSSVLSLFKDGALDLGADGIANPGDLINYTFLVSNDGNTTLTNVSVTDPDVSPITCPSGNPIPSLAPGTSETCTGSYAITQADIDAGQKLNTATADSDQTEPVNSSHTEPIPQSSVLSLLKDGALDLGADGIANPGDLINYTFLVSNDGNTTLTNVSVTDPDVSPITCPSGNPIPSLAPGANETCTGSYAITQTDIDAGQKLNTATADSDQTEPVNSSHTEPIPQSSVLSLFKDGALDLGADGVANPGDLINYTFEVNNDGNTTLTNVSVTDPNVSPITCPSGNPIPSLAPGASETCTGSYAITQADIDAGQKVNTAAADSDQTEPVTSSHTEPIPQNPAIAIAKTGTFNAGADGYADPGELISYVFTVNNKGNVSLTNVTVTDPLVDTITFVAGDTDGDGELDVYETWTYSGSYPVTQADIDAGHRDNTATADSDQTGPTMDDEDVPLPQNPVISIVKTGAFDSGDDTYADPGEIITYEFLVTNEGNLTLTGITVVDPLVGLSAITCPADTLAVGADMTCSATYAVTQDDIDAGSVYNLATADSTESDPADDDETVTLPQNPVISIVKTGAFDSGDDTYADPGEIITYEFLVTNEGNLTLTGITVVDPLVGLSAITCPADTLAVGADMTCSATYAVTQDDIDAGSVYNLATADSTESDPADDDETVTLPQNPVISIVKTGAFDSGDDTYADPGEIITYEFLVTNEGNLTLTGITVVDPLVGLSAITCPADTLAVGADMTCSATYAVTQDDIDTGSVYNLATADSTESDPADDDETVTLPQNPAISIEKSTNGADADTAPGPEILVGSSVFWQYVVTNDGNVTLNNVTVTDNQLLAGDVHCGDPFFGLNSIASLAPDASVTCYATGAAQAGAYANEGTATGTPPSNLPDVSDTDPSHYWGATPSVAIEKSTNGYDADAAPGPEILAGEAVTWQYEVTNDGNVDLTGIVVSDDLLGTICTVDLVAGASTTCSASGTAAAGQYANLGTADFDYTDDSENTTTGSADDPSHYWGATPSVAIEKSTNGYDADAAPGPEILAGEAVTWQYEVTNDGNVDLTGIVVSDDLLGTICTVDLAAGASTTCSASGAAAAGQYQNLGTASFSYTDDSGNATSGSADDPSHYWGASPSVAMEKSTNGFDADTAPGPEILAGEAVTWEYLVTNDGNVDLTGIVVTDDVLGTICTVDLAAGASTTCSASGTAAAGQYANLGTADFDYTDDSGNATTGSADDPSHYWGATPSVAIEKSTNGYDADAAPGPEILEGEAVTWEYVVTNDGNVDLTGIVVSDDVLGTICTVDLVAGASTTCSASGTAAAGQYENLSMADFSYTDDSGNVTTGSADDPSHYWGATPSVAIEKSTNGYDADAAPGPEILEGEAVTWEYVVTNDGNVDLTGIVVSDDLLGTICTVDLLAGASTTCSASGTAAAGQYENLGTASFSYTDDSSNSTSGSADDPSHYWGATPSVQIVKDFAGDEQETVIAGGDPSSFTLVVTNDGNVTLYDVLVTDSVDARLHVTAVAVTTASAAGGETCDAPSQNVSCTIPELAVDEYAIITVDFDVASSEPEDTVSNTGDASSDYYDDSGNSTTVDDTDTDTIDILIDINLEIDKEFDPTSLPQGDTGTFTIKVTNTGPSDAAEVAYVLVDDDVDPLLEVTGLTLPSDWIDLDNDSDEATGDGDPQTIEVSIPALAAGDDDTIIVEYIAAPNLPEEPVFGTEAGDEFRFVFDNGSVLEGSTDGGPVYLDGVDITDQVTLIGGLTRNDILFDPPADYLEEGVDDPAFLMHLSCSDRFIGGWGETDGPAAGIDVNWQIASYSITRYNQNGFIKACGDTPVPFTVDNTATVTWTDSEGNHSLSDTATVEIVDPSLVFPEGDAVDFKNRDVYFKFVSKNPEDMVIAQIEISWPLSDNGNLTRIQLGKSTLWSGNETGAPDPNNSDNVKAIFYAADLGSEAARTLEALSKEKLRFTFRNRPVADPDLVEYTFVVAFADGTDVSITTGP